MAAGLQALPDEVVPSHVVAVLQTTASAIERSGPLEFQESFDGLDSLKVALVDASSRRLALIEHDGTPRQGLEVALDVDRGGLSRGALQELLSALGLSDESIGWLSESDVEGAQAFSAG